MIVSLTGTLVEVLPNCVVLDVSGVGYQMGVSAITAASLPALGTDHVRLNTRLIVREGAIDLYGFSSVVERTVFDRLIGISGVGPKLALSVLSTFSPQALLTVINDQDVQRMATVPGVGKKTASRLIMELGDIFAKDAVLRTLAPEASVDDRMGASATSATSDAMQECVDALLSMGFTQREAELALEGCEEAGATTTERALSYALRRMGGRG